MYVCVRNCFGKKCLLIFYYSFNYKSQIDNFEQTLYTLTQMIKVFSKTKVKLTFPNEITNELKTLKSLSLRLET